MFAAGTERLPLGEPVSVSFVPKVFVQLGNNHFVSLTFKQILKTLIPWLKRLSVVRTDPEISESGLRRAARCWVCLLLCFFSNAGIFQTMVGTNEETINYSSWIATMRVQVKYP